MHSLLLLALAAAGPAAAAEAPEAPLLRIVAIGDTGKAFADVCAADDVPTKARVCAAQARALRAHLTGQAPDLVLATGDLYYGNATGVPAYRSGLRRFWGGWDDAPVLPMRGNHDLGKDVKPAVQPKVAAVLAAAFPLPDGAPWARVPCSGDAGDAERLCYAGARDGVCLVVGDSADVEDIRVPTFPAACAWRIASLHHPVATSYEKKSEIAGVASLLGARGADVVIAGHAHHQEALVAPLVGGGAMLSVVSGAGTELRYPKAALTLADGTPAAVRVDPEDGSDPTGLAPAYVYADHGYTVIDVYTDHLLLKPVVLRDAGPEAAPCWRWDRGATALAPAACPAQLGGGPPTWGGAAN